MAFPIPSHLPRRQDVSSRILNKIDSATYHTLDSAVTSSWLSELDETIQTTKARLHERIQSDLPVFQRQLESAKSIQTRLQMLTGNVDNLKMIVSDPQSGLVPVLLQKLAEHSKLVQEAADVQVQHEALSHILRCKAEFTNLASLVQAGKLPEAVIRLNVIDSLLQSAPGALKQSSIFSDFKRKHQSTEALAQEQLSDAYTRGIVVSASRLVIQFSVQVRGSDNVLPLSSILSSLTPHALDQHVLTLRRDLITHFIEYVLKQPSSLSIGSTLDSEHFISLFPDPPDSGTKSSRIDVLAQILDFLSAHLFPLFPAPVCSTLPQSLFKPIATGLLDMLIIPSLPPSFGLLPPFLALAQKATMFEISAAAQLEITTAVGMPVKTWVDNISSHYEKQRRLELLGNCRNTILTPEELKDRFQFELEVPSELAEPTVVPIQVDEVEEVGGDPEDDAWGFDNGVEEKPAGVGSASMKQNELKDDAWGFDDEEPTEERPPEPTLESAPSDSIPSEDVDNGWGFDDDVPLDDPEPRGEDPPGGNSDPEPDAGDAWGWNEEDLGAEKEQSWEDDPWADPPDPYASAEPTTIPAPITSPKIATRLEKLANKGKKQTNGTKIPENPVAALAPLIASSSNQSPNGSVPRMNKSVVTSSKRPTELRTNIAAKECFAVPDKAKRIIRAIENLIDECKQFQASSLFPSSSSSQPGYVLAQTPASVIDLYIALYPVRFKDELEGSAQRGMLFSNSCLYLCHEVEKIEESLVPFVDASNGANSGFEGLKEKLKECAKNLRVWGESWYERVVQTQCEKVDDILVNDGKGFGNTSSQDRYDECEMAINRAVQEIKRLAQQLKGILTKGKYYTAIGLVTEAVLSRILQDILALPDIPEVDSHQLSELCRILNSLEGLFSEDPAQSSFAIAYVPSWLKFNYLSELLEASMADISYLFEEGALVDFEIDELVRLVKALFADTALRTNLINKLMNGHPMLSS